MHLDSAGKTVTSPATVEVRVAVSQKPKERPSMTQLFTHPCHLPEGFQVNILEILAHKCLAYTAYTS